MLGFIKKIFMSKSNEKENSFAIEISKEEQEKKEKLVKKLAVEELEKIDYFDVSKRDVIIKYILREINLSKSEDNLTVEEKKALGINTRLKISRKLIDVFDMTKTKDDFFKDKNPKKLLSNLYYQVEFKATKIIDLEKMKNAGIKKIILLSLNHHRDCEWCKKQDNKKKTININSDIIKLIYDNCKCDYCRILILPVMD